MRSSSFVPKNTLVAPILAFDDVVVADLTRVKNANGEVLAIPEPVESVSFMNQLVLEPETFTFPVFKKSFSVVEGAILPENYSEEFSLTLTVGHDSDPNTPLPESTTAKTAAFTEAGEKDFDIGAFGTVTFDRPGYYQYFVKENAGSTEGMSYANDGMTYYEIEIWVQEAGGQLLASMSVMHHMPGIISGASRECYFPNTYSNVAIWEVPVAKKVIVHADGVSDIPSSFEGSFSARLATTWRAYPFIRPTRELVQTEQMTGANPVASFGSFGTAEFSYPGTHYYTISEQSSNIPGITDDESVYLVMVKSFFVEGTMMTETTIERIKDSQGQTVSEIVDEIVFTNIYTPSEVPLEDFSLNKSEYTMQLKKTATITCTIDGISSSCTVTVTAVLPVESFSLNYGTLTLRVGEMETLSLQDIFPMNAENLANVKWFTGNANVVAFTTIPGEIRALDKGFAMITCQIGAVKAYCRVTVV